MTEKKATEYWYVHGDAYDLSSYAKVHPGGEYQLNVLRGRDCTEMVYSMHAMASLDKVKKILAKYKVENVKQKEEVAPFIWGDEGLYSVLKTRVNEMFNGKNHKSDFFFWFVSALEFLAQIALFYFWISGRSYLSPFITGLLTTSLGFMIFHTAGHNGISKNPKVNNFWYKLFADYILGFISDLWNIHHNYAHHCYTNIHRKDPDVSNALAVIRKNPYQTPKPIHKQQWYVAYILLVFMPNQWFGQVLQYLMSTMRGKIFGVPLIQKNERKLSPFVIFGAIGLALFALVAFKQGLGFAMISIYLYSCGVGFAYWACVFPNHDTDLSEQSNVDDVVKNGADWGEHQVRHSSNFWLPDIFSLMVGGMNYQIEHHLFPTINPRFYPKISKIVREECAKRKIPYHLHSSWFHALKGNFNHLWTMSKLKKKE